MVKRLGMHNLADIFNAMSSYNAYKAQLFLSLGLISLGRRTSVEVIPAVDHKLISAVSLCLLARIYFIPLADCPVMKPDFSDARNDTTLATSWVSPIRFRTVDVAYYSKMSRI